MNNLLTPKFFPIVLTIQEFHLHPYNLHTLREYKCYKNDLLGGESINDGNTHFVHSNITFKIFRLSNTSFQANTVTAELLP